MGVLVFVLGLAAAGVVIDFLVENGLGGGPDVTFQLFGGTFDMTVAELVLGAAALGATAIAFIGLGLALMGVSWGKRRGRAAELRELRTRLDDSERRHQALERENAELARREAVRPEVVDVRPDQHETTAAPASAPPADGSVRSTTS